MPKAKDKSPKPESGRRQNVANSSDVGNPRRSTSKERKCTSTPPNKTGKKDDVQSTENVKSAKELLEEIQEYRREAEKWMNCDTDTGSQTSQNSVNNISTAKPIKSGIVTEVVVAEVHQTEKSNDTTKKKRLRHRTLSHESAVRFADELLEGSEELVKVRKSIESPEVELSPKSQQSRQSRNQTTFNETVLSNLKLIASSKLVCQQRRASSLPRPRSTFLYPPTYPVTLFQDYSRDYEHYSPPSPAPDNPYEKQFVLIGAYSNNVSLSLPSVTPRPLREPTFDNFLTYGRSINIHEPAPLFKSASAEVIPATDHLTYRPIPISSLRYQSKTIGGPYEIASYFERTPTEYKYDLPTISSYQSPKKQLHRKSRQGASEFEGASYKTEPSHRSFLTDSDYETLKFGKLTPEPCQHPDDREFLKRLTREIHRSSRGSARKFLDLSPDFIEDVDQEKLLKLLKKYYEKLLQELFSGRHAKVARFLSSRGHILLSQAKSLRHRRSFVIDLLKKLKKMKLADHERKIVIEFCHLLEKSKQLFNGLRELPQYGHKQWHSYFGRTFDVYTKLWKFQQQHRVILDVKYGLKRWQIGEIASKIGQLYYHFYLRTSETAYLNEAYSFYYAIRGRSYYTHASKEDRCELMVKKLRYYARFIVASLLLKKLKLVRDLIKELDRQIIEYGDTFDPDDQNEWKIVADEVKAFIQAEPVVVVLHPDDYVVALTHRLTPQTTPPVDRSAMMTLSLQEALIIGSNPVQVKFSELTMDMFRMLQTLEREPTGDIQHMYDESPRQRYASSPGDANNKGYNLESSNKSSPHKYLLFKPTPNQIFIYLASACDDLPPNGVVLLYISAEGLIVPPMKHPVDSNGFDMGGLITTSKPDIIRDGKLVPQKHTELQVLHPGDLYPFTRRPMFLIIDSDNSFIFHDLPRYFGQPLVVLMSPLEQPSSLHPTAGDKRAEGSLFTLFLHCPLSAFCFCCDINTLTLGQWERAQTFIEAFLAEASQIVTRSRIDGMYLAFMGDDFLRLLILRFIFCETFLRMHRLFRGRSQRTRCSPPLPDDLYEHPGLTHIIIDLATHFQVRSHFHELSAMPASLASNRE